MGDKVLSIAVFTDQIHEIAWVNVIFVWGNLILGAKQAGSVKAKMFCFDWTGRDRII